MWKNKATCIRTIFHHQLISSVLRMEQYTSKLISVFLDFDAISFLSQITLDDMSIDDIFMNRREDEKLVIMLDRFCDWTLKSIRLFMAHKKIEKVSNIRTLENISDFPKDIPSALVRVQEKILHLLRILEKEEKNITKKEDEIYILRLFRLFNYIKKEIMYFIRHEAILLLHIND